MRDSRGDEPYLAVNDRRRCKKNSPSVLSCLDKRTKVIAVVAKIVQQFTADKRGKGQLLESYRLKKSGKREICEIGFITNGIASESLL